MSAPSSFPSCPSLLTLFLPYRGTPVAWTLGKLPPGTPLPIPTLRPGNCSNLFSKALNTEILSAAVGLPLVPVLPCGGPAFGTPLPTNANPKFFKKTHTQPNKSTCAHVQGRDGETRGMNELKRNKLGKYKKEKKT